MELGVIGFVERELYWKLEGGEEQGGCWCGTRPCDVRLNSLPWWELQRKRGAFGKGQVLLSRGVCIWSTVSLIHKTLRICSPRLDFCHHLWEGGQCYNLKMKRPGGLVLTPCLKISSLNRQASSFPCNVPQLWILQLIICWVMRIAFICTKFQF